MERCDNLESDNLWNFTAWERAKQECRRLEREVRGLENATRDFILVNAEKDERIKVLEEALEKADRLQKRAWHLACKAREYKLDSAHIKDVFLASSQYDRARADTQPHSAPK